MSQPYRLNDEVLRAVNILREHRRRIGWSVEDMAKAMGVSRGTVYNWENGRLAYTAVRLINFLANDLYMQDGDGNIGGHGAFYWRERCFAAETALQQITKFLLERKDKVDSLK